MSCRTCLDDGSFAVVSPEKELPPPATSVSPAECATADDLTTTPTNLDVLCGRGKGIRRHLGNTLYNKLLKENYDEYRAAPKGSKALIVKKIVSIVRDGQPGGRGRFLERKKRTDKTRGNTTWCYIDIGNERAMNKTAQAFRDIRVTMEKQQSGHNQHQTQHTPAPEDEASEDSDSLQELSGEDRGTPEPSGPRRPTFRERLAMLHRQQHRCDDSENTSGDDESGDEEEIEHDVSDTETEDSFPMYSSHATRVAT